MRRFAKFFRAMRVTLDFDPCSVGFALGLAPFYSIPAFELSVMGSDS